MEHGLDTIPNVEVGFFLIAVAEDFQMVGVGEQLFVKIQHMAVRITLAEDGDREVGPASCGGLQSRHE
jgi:hypothetical protein